MLRLQEWDDILATGLDTLAGEVGEFGRGTGAAVESMTLPSNLK